MWKVTESVGLNRHIYKKAHQFPTQVDRLDSIYLAIKKSQNAPMNLSFTAWQGEEAGSPNAQRIMPGVVKLERYLDFAQVLSCFLQLLIMIRAHVEMLGE